MLVSFLVLTLTGTAVTGDDPAPWSLQECQRIAVAQSPMVRAAKFGVQTIEEQERELWWTTWIPTLKLRSLAILIPPQGDSDPSDGPDLSELNFWSRTDIEAYLPVYTFGKLSAARDMAEHGIDAANAILGATRNELAYQVARAWYSIQLANGLAELIVDGEDKIQKAREKLEQLEEDDSEDYDQADTFRLRIYEAEVRKLVLGNAKLDAVSKTGLKAAMGLARTAELRLPAENALDPIEVDIASLEKLIELASRHRPELAAQRHRIEIARSQVDLRWSEFFPDIFVAGSFTVAASTVDNSDSENVFEGAVFNAIGGGATFGLQLTLDYPQKIHRYHRAQAELNRARAEVEGRLALLGVELEEVWRDAKAHQEMLEYRRRAMRAAKSLLTLNAHEYENGIDDSTTFKMVLDASVTYLSQKSEWLKAVHAFNLSVARLSRTVGVNIVGVDITEQSK